MELIPNLAFFVAGILISTVGALLVCHKLISAASHTATASSEAERATLVAQLEASMKRSGEISAEVVELESKVSELLDSRASEIARRAAAEEQVKRIAEIENQLREEQQKQESLSSKLVELEKEKSELSTAVQKDREAFEEKVQLLEDAKKQLSGMFAELSNVALQSNNQQFLNLAKQAFESLQEGARLDLDHRQKTIADLVSPVKVSLDKVDLKIQEMEIARVGAYAGLNQLMTTLAATEQGLRTETSNLVKALRSPKVRGVWGEMQLKRVIELSGMIEHCDFVEQHSVSTEAGLLRPDVLINMPGGKKVVVDSKAPLEAYLEAIALDDDAARNLKLKDHARQVRKHVTDLGKKSYCDALETTPDYVVLFVPGEAFYTAAIDQDPSLIEYALEKGVILAAPTTLIALLKAVAYGWREESLKENALKISELGRELYDRLVTMGGHVTKLGRSLGNAVESYNQTVGSLESRVLVTARKFQGLSVTNGNGTEIEQMVPVESVPRLLQSSEFSSRQEPSLTQ